MIKGTQSKFKWVSQYDIDKLSEIEKTRLTLIECNELYRTSGDSPLSDQEYDSLMESLPPSDPFRLAVGTGLGKNWVPTYLRKMARMLTRNLEELDRRNPALRGQLINLPDKEKRNALNLLSKVRLVALAICLF